MRSCKGLCFLVVWAFIFSLCSSLSVAAERKRYRYYKPQPAKNYMPDLYIHGGVGRIAGGLDFCDDAKDTILTLFQVNASETKCSQKKNVYQLGVGVRNLVKRLSFEFNYMSLGNMEWEGELGPRTVAVESKWDGFSAAMLIGIPFNPKFTVYGKLGAFHSRVKNSHNIYQTDVPSNAQSDSSKVSDTTYLLGAVAEYRLSGPVLVRGDIQYIGDFVFDEVNGDDQTTDLTLYNLGLVVEF